MPSKDCNMQNGQILTTPKGNEEKMGSKKKIPKRNRSLKIHEIPSLRFKLLSPPTDLNSGQILDLPMEFIIDVLNEGSFLEKGMNSIVVTRGELIIDGSVTGEFEGGIGVLEVLFSLNLKTRLGIMYKVI